MYFGSILFIFLLLIFLTASACRIRWAVKKVCSLTCSDKYELFDNLLKPFGYYYNPYQDIISTRLDAWQRNVGYTALFDHAAVPLHMIFDFLPVYFDYQGRTWLIEFWKGQYGINTGAEIGIYYADRILEPSERSTAHFSAVTDTDLLPVSFALSKNEQMLARVSKKTWWLTAFCMGTFSTPQDLVMEISMNFPCAKMMYSFLNSLYKASDLGSSVRICGLNVSFSYCNLKTPVYSFFKRLFRGWIQFTNWVLCNIYLAVTHHFLLTVDRMLYLYYLLPFAFRKTLRLHKYSKKHIKEIQ